MAGVIFIICVPTEEHEKLLKSTKTQIIIAENDSVEFSERNVDNTYERKFKYKEKTQNDSMSDIPIKISPIPKSKSADMLRVGEQIKQPIIHKSWDGIEAITSSIKSNSNEDCDLRDPNMPIEKVLRHILEKQNIKNAAWTKVDNGNFLQVIFPLESGNHCEGTLAVLNEYGIGQRLNSTVSVIPCSLYYKEEPDSDKFDTEKEEPKIQLKNYHVKNTAWNRFVASVRARLTVAQVVEGIKANATLTFDFLILLFIATILSAISLAENNNIYLVSSMLISPMMGPVMAGTFGSVIKDRKLQKIGVQNELIGLGIATAVGFCYGIIITSVTDKYGSNSWPTSEMVSRGEVRTLWVGCLIALLSGAAVALGILGDNIASLVGVAISASLMPPAVNAGLLWAMSLVYAFAGENSSKSIVRTNYYSNDEVWELAALGGISMCLTFVNIVCIYIAGILVFKIKEVAPISAKDQSRRFWKYDIKIARDYNRTLQHEEGQALSKRLSNELTGFNATNYNAPLLGNIKLENKRKMEIVTDHLCQSTELAREHCVDIGRNQNTWSPCTFAPKRPTIQELKHLYFSLLDNEPKAQRSFNYNVFPRGLQNYPWSNPGSSQIYNDENVLPQIPEDAVIDNETKPLLSQNPRLNSHAFRTTRKFVVTPVFLDANTDNVNT